MAFWKRNNSNNSSPSPSETTAIPVQGELRPSGAQKATVLRSKEIGLAVVAALVIMAVIFYFLMAGIKLHFLSSTKPVQQTSGKAPPMSVPPDNNVITPPVKQAPTGGGPSHTPPAQSSGAQQAAGVANKTQYKAFRSALSGGTDVVNWSTTLNQRKPQPAPPPASRPQTAKGKNAHVSVYSAHLVHKEVSPYELLQGTVIPAVLETGIKSDLPGMITAIVRNPVYSSQSGADVLIPAGSKLIGTYSNRIIAGDTRVAVAWTRVLFPNGTYIKLGKGMPGASNGGYSGFHDLVDNHTWAIFRSALLLSIIDIGMAVSSPQQTATANGVVTGNVALAEGEQGLAQTFGQAEAQLLQREINIAPTLTIPSGYPFAVVVTKDLVFPGPYRHGTNVQSQPVLPVAGPTTIDRYGGA